MPANPNPTLMRPRSFHFLMILLLVSAAAHARADERRTLLVRGRVLGPEGWPVVGVAVTASGTRTARAVSDGQGAYALYVPLPTAKEVAETPLALRLAPVRDGWTFARAGGKGVGGLEAEIVGPPARVRVRAPDAAFAAAVANAFADRSVSVVFADLDFTGAPAAAGAADAPVEMLGQSIVPVSGVKVPRRAVAVAPPTVAPPRAEPPAPPPGTPTRGNGTSASVPGSDATAARAARARADSLAAALKTTRAAAARAAMARVDSVRAADARRLSARRDSIAAALRAERAASAPPAAVAERPAGPSAPTPVTVPTSMRPGPPAVSAPAESCECVIKGTVEARSDRRIPEYLRISVWLGDRPASRDSVELFMGSPRPFEMRAPCGSHQLQLRVEPRLQHYALRPPEAFQRFTCVRERPSQWQLVLVVR